MEFIKASAFAALLGFGLVGNINGMDGNSHPSFFALNYGLPRNELWPFVGNPIGIFKLNYPERIPVSPSYSHAVLITTKLEKTLHISGMPAYDNSITPSLIHYPVEATCKIMDNIIYILEKNCMGLTDVVDVTLFVRDINWINAVNQAYIEYFNGLPMPSRSEFAPAFLPYNAPVEIKVTARKILCL